MNKQGLLTLVFAFTSFAADSSTPIKECKTTIKMEDKTMEAEITFIEKDKKIISLMKQKMNGQTVVLEDVAKISEHDIRKDLLDHNIDTASDEFLDSLNSGEKYILHAAAFSDEDKMNELIEFLDKGKLKNECSEKEKLSGAGFDLRKAKHVKVYEMQGDPGDMSKLAVIEATDANGKIIGSFFGGFLVSACK